MSPTARCVKPLRKGSLAPLYREKPHLTLTLEGKAESNHSSSPFTSRCWCYLLLIQNPAHHSPLPPPKAGPLSAPKLVSNPKSPSASVFPQKHLASNCGPSLLPLKAPQAPDNAGGTAPPSLTSGPLPTSSLCPERHHFSHPQPPPGSL